MFHDGCGIVLADQAASLAQRSERHRPWFMDKLARDTRKFGHLAPDIPTSQLAPASARNF
jgi:hypothetical protein